MAELITILLADDHPVVRRGLRSTIEQEGDLRVVAEAADGVDALQQIKEHRPKVAVLDMDMPKLNGLGIARELAAQEISTHIIFLTLHSDEDLMRAAMGSGASGYLLKGSEIDEICTAIRAVDAGRTYIGSAMAALLFGDASQGAAGQQKPNINILSPTEKRILALISDGLASKEIADELNIHYRTVENHRTNICRKLQIEGANALARYALQHRLALQGRMLSTDKF